MDQLLEDLGRRHKRPHITPPFVLSDEVFVIDMLAQRRSDTHPRRLLIVDTDTGVGTVRISTCYPDPGGECLRPFSKSGDPKFEGYTGVEHTRCTELKVRYEVDPELVKHLKKKRIVFTSKDPRVRLAPNEYLLDYDRYVAFRKEFGDIEYTLA